MNENYKNTIFLLERIPKLLPDYFAIITAYNPMDRQLSKVENKKLNNALLKKIENFNEEIIPIIGSSLDLTHKEPSYLVKVALNKGIETAQFFNQRAIFWAKYDKLYLIDCSSREKTPIGSFSERMKLLDV